MTKTDIALLREEIQYEDSQVSPKLKKVVEKVFFVSVSIVSVAFMVVGAFQAFRWFVPLS